MIKIALTLAALAAIGLAPHSFPAPGCTLTKCLIQPVPTPTPTLCGITKCLIQPVPTPTP
jgi:hypothetical protein